MTPAILVHDTIVVTVDADGGIHHPAFTAVGADRIARRAWERLSEASPELEAPPGFSPAP